MSAINGAGAKIDLSYAEAKGDVAVGKRSVFFHLTKGFSLSQSEDNNAEPGFAFTGTGHLPIVGDLTNWNFGFVQIAKMNSGRAFYAGRKKSEGGVGVFFDNAMTSKVLLDSLDTRSPWTVGVDRWKVESGQIKCVTADHPALKVPREVRNAGRNVQNFLFHVLDDREFWTVLGARTPTDKMEYYAYFHWQVSHNVKFNWVNGDPVVDKNNSRSTYSMLEKGKGPPTSGELKSLLDNPDQPQFNKASEDAMIKAYWGARGANRVEVDESYMNVPRTFWT